MQDLFSNVPLIKAGTQFGGTGGGPFDDSSMISFIPSHYLSGMLSGDNFGSPFAWCQFLYSSPDNPDNILESQVHGTRRTTDEIERFILMRNERINKVQIVVDRQTLLVNDIERSVPLIRGVRFFTTQGRQSSSLDHIEGERSTEQFNGYTVAYVTGRKGLLIDQLQFHWRSGEYTKRKRKNLIYFIIESHRDSDISAVETRWMQNGVTVVGGSGSGDNLNQISYPSGLYVDDVQTIYVTERNNHRVVEWTLGATSGRIVCGWKWAR